jgi:dienelactone hydrolase
MPAELAARVGDGPYVLALGTLEPRKNIARLVSAFGAVADAHPDVAVHVYAADHGFHCDERGSYDAAASKQAMGRTLDFMKKHVG